MSNDPVDGGTVRYHRADFRPATDEPWLVWFTKDQADPYWFTAEQGEAMGLTPPEPAPLVVTCNGHSIELSDEQARLFAESWEKYDPGYEWDKSDGPRVSASPVLAGLLRDARQDPQPTSDPCPNCNDSGVVETYDGLPIGPCDCTDPQPEQDDTASGIDFDALPDGTVLLRTDGRPGVRIKVDGVWTFDGHGIAAPLLRKNWKVHQPAPLSPGECLRGLLAGRDDADELIAHPYRHQVSWLSIIGDAAHGGA